MRTLLLAGLAAVAVGLGGCCGPDECNLPEGSACTGNYQCDGALKCFDGQCRVTCTTGASCTGAMNCVADPTPTSSTTTPVSACVPAPGSSELWRVNVVNTLNAFSPTSELGDPDPFVCLVIDQTTLCTEEHEGLNVSYTKNFTTTFPTSALSNVSVTVFESDDIGNFGGCEGACSNLAGWSKETLHGEAIDARPLWSLHKQPWTLLGASSLRVDLEILPAQ